MPYEYNLSWVQCLFAAFKKVRQGIGSLYLGEENIAVNIAVKCAVILSLAGQSG